MSEWQVIFLGVMAGALVLMALAQFAVALALVKALKSVLSTVDELKREIHPLMQKVNRIADDAERVTALAVVQAERIDGLVKQTTERMDETFGLLRSAVIDPIRQGSAIITAVKAAISAVRSWQNRPANSVREDEDPLFVG